MTDRRDFLKVAGVTKHQTRKVTERLNAVYVVESSGLETPVRRAQARSLGADAW